MVSGFMQWLIRLETLKYETAKGWVLKSFKFHTAINKQQTHFMELSLRYPLKIFIIFLLLSLHIANSPVKDIDRILDFETIDDQFSPKLLDNAQGGLSCLDQSFDRSSGSTTDDDYFKSDASVVEADHELSKSDIEILDERNDMLSLAINGSNQPFNNKATNGDENLEMEEGKNLWLFWTVRCS